MRGGLEHGHGMVGNVDSCGGNATCRRRRLGWLALFRGKAGPWTEEEREVNERWLERVKPTYEAQGYSDFSWSNSDRVQERLEDGKVIVYECDEESHTKYKHVRENGQVLLARKKS